MTYGHFQNFICSSFDQEFYLKVKKQFEKPLVSILDPKFKNNGNGEEENVIADFTTPGESHFVWPSPVPLQTP